MFCVCVKSIRKVALIITIKSMLVPVMVPSHRCPQMLILVLVLVRAVPGAGATASPVAVSVPMIMSSCLLEKEGEKKCI